MQMMVKVGEEDRWKAFPLTRKSKVLFARLGIAWTTQLISINCDESTKQ